MDIAERAAMRKLIEMDLDGETEFNEDYSIKSSVTGFPATPSSFVIGLSKRQ